MQIPAKTCTNEVKFQKQFSIEIRVIKIDITKDNY